MLFKNFAEFKIVFLSQKELNEIRFEKWQYAGRNISGKGNTYVWIYIVKPGQKGLLWADPDGNVYLKNSKISKISAYDDVKGTHKQIVASAYNSLNISNKEGMSGNLRKDVDTIVDGFESYNVRGRVVMSENTNYVYPASAMSPFDEKRYNTFAKKALRDVNRYIPEK